MKKSPDHHPEAGEQALTGAWTFLPYEEEHVAPRNELQVLRAVHSLFIPLADLITLTLAVIGSYFIAETLVNGGRAESILGAELGIMSTRVLWAGLGTIPLWMLVFSYYGVYRREVRRLSVSTFDELPQTIGAVAVGAWVMYSFLILTSKGNPSGRAVWVFVAIAWVMLMFLIPLGRAVVRIGLSFRNPFLTSTLVVGAGEVGKSLIGRLERHKEYGLRVIGFLDTTSVEEEQDDERPKAHVQLLGRPSDLRSIVEKYGISRVIIAFTKTPHPLILGVIHECQEMKVDVSIVPRFFQALSPRVEIDDIEGLPVMSLPRYSRHGRVLRVAKRLLDLAGALFATVILSPVLLIVAVAIKLDSRGPIFFTQQRMGKNHKQFPDV